MALDKFKGTFPYASELFGVYQPLLGWRSKLITRRFERARLEVYRSLADRIMLIPPEVSVRIGSERSELLPMMPHVASVDHLRPLRFPQEIERYIAPRIDSAVARLVSQKLDREPPSNWRALVGYDEMMQTLREVQQIVTTTDLLTKNADVADYVKSFLAQTRSKEDEVQVALQAMFERECSIAGYLSFLATHSPSSLTALFYRQPSVELVQAVRFDDPLLNFGENNYDAILSPLGVVHLFREYFFEFDSFLGPPVGHQWLSPGGTVELIEINTRKVFTERTLEMATETTQRSESQTTTQDDLADAVKEENRNDVKLGFSLVANYSSPCYGGTANASFSLDSAKTSARETTHKQMRQQSEKLSSEIRKSFKTTFKTSTEETATASKRYVLQNTTAKLVNYELRRKMREVGVQVQDIGTQLCWTTFVDDPGRELGISKLVHIAKPAELGDLPQPDAPEMPKAVSQDVNINIPFVGLDTDNTDKAYTNGVGDGEHILTDFPQSATFTQPKYTLQQVTIDPQGADALVSVRGLSSPEGSSTGSFTVRLDYVHWHKASTIPVTAKLLWAPSKDAVNEVNTEHSKRMGSYNAEKTRRFKEAFYNAARERIKAASTIQPRPAEDLREEERTVVYRALIKQLMSVGDGTKHVISELVRSIFDVDKMLYFVAPEWWAPRLHESGQHLGEQPPNKPPGHGGPHGSPALLMRRFSPDLGGLGADVVVAPVSGVAVENRGAPIPAENTVDWGGGRESGRDNYYITEESAPAKLGSSLGWLLQLDGDNLRNAVLNSPWVKAIIPIRLGKEKAAINWLQQAHVEGSDGLDAEYAASPDDPTELHSTPGDPVTVKDALEYLIAKIQQFNEKASTPVMPNPADPQDPRNHFAGSLPTEAVFEHGFYPLQGGIKLDEDGTVQSIFSQWVEVLPTDQVAALEVEYDPKTLRVKDSPS